MRNSTLVLAGALSLSVLPAILAAQEAPTAQYRQGIWIEVGSGLGHAQLDCSGCGPLPHGPPWQSGGGVALFAAAGVTPLPNLLVGGEVNAFFRGEDGGEARPSPGVNDRVAYLGHVGVTARFYPLAGTPLFVKAGGGLGGYRLEEINRYKAWGAGGGLIGAPPSYRDRSETRSMQTLAGALQAGVGYELDVGHGVALTPIANLIQLYTGNVEREFRGQMVTAPRNPRYVHMGLAVRIYPERMRYVDRPGME